MGSDDDDTDEGGSALEAFADACVEAWSALVAPVAAGPVALSSEGVEAVEAAGGGDVDETDASEEDEGDFPAVVVFAPAKGDVAGLLLVLRAPDAQAFHGLVSGSTAEGIDAQREGELSERVLREVDGWLGRSVAALATPFVESEALELGVPLPAVVVRDGRTLARWIAGPAERLRIEIAPEGADIVRADLYVADAAPAPDVLRSAACVLVVAPTSAVRAELARLERALGRCVRHVEAGDLPRDFSVYTGAAAFVVAWRQGRCAGLDVVEQIRASRAVAGRPLAMADAEPTDDIVRAALRGGASTFLHLPLDPEEVRARLLPDDAPTERAADAGGPGASADEAPSEASDEAADAR
ncbi:MAG: hypothetical protein KC560_21225 [Myxococcales bacterium]|nr:hypothetical protein [Myxococcales bacterium]